MSRRPGVVRNNNSGPRLYANNAENRRIGRAGQPVGTHVVHNNGSVTHSPRVYADNAENHRIGRAGQPVGTHIVHNNGSADVHSPRVYVDNAENRRIGRVGQVVGTHVIHNNGTVWMNGPRVYADNAENHRIGRAGQPVGTHVLHRSRVQDERQAPLVTTPHHIPSSQSRTTSSPMATQNDQIQTSSQAGYVNVTENHRITSTRARAEQAARSHVHNNAAHGTTVNQSQDQVSRSAPTTVVPVVTVSTRTTSSGSTLLASQSQPRSTCTVSADASSPSVRSAVATTAIHTRSVVVSGSGGEASSAASRRLGSAGKDEPDTTSEDIIYIEDRDIPHSLRGVQTTGQVLGHGENAKVCEGMWNGKPIALKAFKVSVAQTRSERWRTKLETEGEHLRKLVHVHPNIADFYGLMLDTVTGTIILLIEHLPCSLYQALFVEKRNYQEPKKMEILKQVSEGLEFLHRNNVFLGNLTSKNVCLSFYDMPKIESFGPKLWNGTSVTNNLYAAPELVTSTSIPGPDHKADVYSLAIVAYELLEEKEAYDGLPSRVAARMRRMGNRDACPFFHGCRNAMEILNFLTKCWNANPRRRPEAAEFVEMLDI